MAKNIKKEKTIDRQFGINTWIPKGSMIFNIKVQSIGLTFFRLELKFFTCE